MKELIDAWKKVDRNKIAALLSVIPGLGHLYKHHYVAGLGLLIGGNALMIFVALWLSLATFGLSLILVPLLWFAGIGFSAYYASDEHGARPWIEVWQERRGKSRTARHQS
jgi:membrane protein implicated in regulation of membrane protease activity